jgi:hypothetical protein
VGNVSYTIPASVQLAAPSWGQLITSTSLTAAVVDPPDVLDAPEPSTLIELLSGGVPTAFWGVYRWRAQRRGLKEKPRRLGNT